jgi:hypothetical protein
VKATLRFKVCDGMHRVQVLQEKYALAEVKEDEVLKVYAMYYM